MLPARQDEETGLTSFVLDTENEDLSTKLEAYAKRMMLPMTIFEDGPQWTQILKRRGETLEKWNQDLFRTDEPKNTMATLDLQWRVLKAQWQQ